MISHQHAELHVGEIVSEGGKEGNGPFKHLTKNKEYANFYASAF